MRKCNLVIDTCCDLPRELLDHEGLYIIQYPYIIDDVSYEDDLFESVTAQEFYDGMREGKQPSTAQVSLSALTELFEELAKSDLPSVFLSFSSGLSGSYDAACVLLETMKEDNPSMDIRIVDSHLASIAEGMLVYGAIEQWLKGLTADELTAWAEEARYFVNEAFMVDDLEALHRGGRIPASVAVAGTALDVKPLLRIDADGTLSVTGVARGRKKGMKALIDKFEKTAAEQDDATVVLVGHADCLKDAERLAEMVKKSRPNALPIMCNIGPVIGSHVGPGMLAVVYWGMDKRDMLSVTDRIARKVKGGNA